METVTSIARPVRVLLFFSGTLDIVQRLYERLMGSWDWRLAYEAIGLALLLCCIYIVNRDSAAKKRKEAMKEQARLLNLETKHNELITWIEKCLLPRLELLEGFGGRDFVIELTKTLRQTKINATP